MAKLSKKMQEVMDNLMDAEYGYMDMTAERREQSISYLYTKRKGGRDLSRAGIYKFKGEFTLGVRESTSTIKALEKRGLIKVSKYGGDCMDFVNLVDFKHHEPIEKLVKVDVTAKWFDDYCQKDLVRTITMYTDMEIEDFKQVIKQEDFYKDRDTSFMVMKEVEPTLWSFND